ncbi:glycosyltransferase [Massilia sp. H-1]|nr:glycosyltransferase [Massilia sp. H-1]
MVEACFAQSDRNFEIIIADDGSTANTRECIEALKARSPVALQHVWQPDDGFRAAMARNRGTLAARGEYIVFLDGDCVPQRDFIAQHRKLAKRGFLVSGSRVLLSAELTARILSEHIDLLRPMAPCSSWATACAAMSTRCCRCWCAGRTWGAKAQRFTWRRIKSCNLGVWRSDLDMVDGFDESFLGWGHEDSDLVVRLFNASA